MQKEVKALALPKRKPNRLKQYDYSSHGAYFVTICTEGKIKILCDIVGDGFPVPKQSGRIATEWIEKIPEKYPNVSIVNYVAMPNHIHILLMLDRTGGTGNPSPTLDNIIGMANFSNFPNIGPWHMSISCFLLILLCVKPRFASTQLNG